MIVPVPKTGFAVYEMKYFLEANLEDRPNIKHITIDDEGTKVNGKLVESSEDDLIDDEDLEGEEDFDGDGDTDLMDTIDDDGEIDIEDDESFDDDEIPDEEDGEGGEEVPSEDGGDTEDGVATEDTEDFEGGDVPEEGGEGGGDDIPTEDSEGEEGINDTGGDGEENIPEEDAEDSTGGGEGEDTGEEDNENSEDMNEKIRKRALFQRFRTLHDAVDKYVEKLNMLMAYSANMVSAYQEVCDDFIQIRDCLYDYMLAKFSSSKLTESALFYQRALAATALALENLQDLVKKAKAEDLSET